MVLLSPRTVFVGCSNLRPSYISRALSSPLTQLGRPSRTHSIISPLQPYIIEGKTYPLDSFSNIPPSILSKLPRSLHTQPNHPISILRQIIESHFSTFNSIIPSSPVVTVHENFDELGFPPDHPGRALTDSYYLNKEHMLRTHTSAHEVGTYRKDLNSWLLTADVYRRDEIDSSHYPVFHQMEGTHIWSKDQLNVLPELNRKLSMELKKCPLIIEDPTKVGPNNPYQIEHDPVHAAEITQHLKHSLNSLIFRLFGQSATHEGEPLRVRWIEAFFPFTTPSYEVEVWWNGEWLELLGCGVVMQRTLDQAGVGHKAGWAFGLGLERIAMVLFDIPDIRLFWSTDPRFISQFSPGQITQFKPYSKYPPCYKDMSFWLPISSVFHENDFCEIVRDVAGDLVETVELIDDFTHPKTGRQSKCYRLNYRSMDRSLSNEEVNVLQDQVQRRVVQEMGIEMR
ncbi:phenylalanine-tRNA ligase [Tremella mesenterica]|uniref:Phenylalanine--tRNA ligase, mitochondrial n=1 Tax=Tremella mesenterica TaxID=5217 RepID=A0A4Q1BFZ9_TREME|nr:phenylalanine-tRNA ligase [Tremella mesenterica]